MSTQADDASAYFRGTCVLAQTSAKRDCSRKYKHDFNIDCTPHGRREPVHLDPGKIKVHEFRAQPKPRANFSETVADMCKRHEAIQCRPAKDLLEIMGRAPPLIRFDECAADLATRLSVDVVIDEHAIYAMVVEGQRKAVAHDELVSFVPIPFEVRASSCSSGANNQPFIDPPPATTPFVSKDNVRRKYFHACLAVHLRDGIAEDGRTRKKARREDAAVSTYSHPPVCYSSFSLGEVVVLVRHRLALTGQSVVAVKDAGKPGFTSAEAAVWCTKCFLTKKDLLCVYVREGAAGKAYIERAETIPNARVVAAFRSATPHPLKLLEPCSELLVDMTYLEPGDFLLRYGYRIALGKDTTTKKTPSGIRFEAEVCQAVSNAEPHAFDFHSYLDYHIDGEHARA